MRRRTPTGRPPLTPAQTAERDAASRALRDLRLALGLNQSDVARDLGVSRQAVSQWETGERSPSPKARGWVREHGDCHDCHD